MNQEDGSGNARLERQVRRMVEAYFAEQRFSEHNHLGLGDIRLTIGQQEEILNMIADA